MNKVASTKLILAAALLAVGVLIAGPAMDALATDLPSAGAGLLGPAPGAPGTAAPRADVADPVYNFGTALSGPPLKHAFMIRNAGGAPLKIGKVITSCGCTAAKPSKTVLAPGEEITAEIIDYLRLELKAGIRIQGPYDDELKVIRVVKE